MARDVAGPSGRTSTKLFVGAVGVSCVVCLLLLELAGSSGRAIDIMAPAVLTQSTPVPVPATVDPLQRRVRLSVKPFEETAFVPTTRVEPSDAAWLSYTQLVPLVTDRPEKVVECTLSNLAAQTQIWKRLASRCYVCNASRRPDFCDPSSFPSRLPMFSFSGSGTYVAPTGSFDMESDFVDVVYSALGQRFSGPGGQSYVLDAIRQWRLIHPPSVSRVFLVVDDNMTSIPEIVALQQSHDVELVSRSSIMTPLWKRYIKVFYIQGYMHPGGSRKTGHKHFNQLVSERFFALHGLMKRKQLRHVLHFENDNMVYADMRPVVSAADRCGARLASTFASAKHVIPGAMYIRDADSIGHFCQFLNEFLSCGEEYGRKFTRRHKDYANDMTYLMTYYQRYGSGFLAALPTWEHKPHENCIADVLWNVGTNNGSAVRVARRSLFDLASFGQWYSFSVGSEQPPQNVRDGLRGRLLDATPPPRMLWKKTGTGSSLDSNVGADRMSSRALWVPYWKDIRLLSLHIHAKNLFLFRSDRSEEMPGR